VRKVKEKDQSVGVALIGLQSCNSKYPLRASKNAMQCLRKKNK